MTFVVRQGRTRNANDWDVQARHGIKALITILVIAALTLYFPVWLYNTEVLRRETFAAFTEAEELAVHLPGDQPPAIPRPDARDAGKLVFFSSKSVRATQAVQPSGFDFKVQDAVRVRWTPEYCQWDEAEECEESCSGDGDNQDCSTTCSTTYVKSWHYRRINSLLFDQPAAHHNPQRDPRPPHTDTAPEVAMGSFRLTEAVSSKLEAFRALKWSLGGAPKPETEYGFLQRWSRAFWRWGFDWEDRTRWEPLKALEAHLKPDPADPERFGYIGDGYFYSEYAGGTAGTVLNWLGQYVEGSLFDWQLGDLLGKAFNACEAGDIRGSFQVADPKELTVLAGVLDAEGTLGEHQTQRGFKLGLVGEGDLTMKALMDREKTSIRQLLYLQRALCVLWAYFVLWLAAQLLPYAGYTPACGAVAGVQARELLGLGLAGLLVAGKWWLVYGINDFSGHETSWSTLALLAGSCAMMGAGGLATQLRKPPDFQQSAKKVD